MTMRRIDWTILCGLALSLAMSAILSGLPAPVPLAESYRCRGISGGEQYALTLTIATLGGGYSVKWSDMGQTLYAGWAVRHGDALAAVFGDRAGRIAISSYAISAGRLVGSWMDGSGETQTETCLTGNPA